MSVSSLFAEVMLIQLEVTEQVAKFIIKNLEINLVTSSFPTLGNQNRTDIEVTKNCSQV